MRCAREASRTPSAEPSYTTTRDISASWLSGRLAGRPVICTYKAAIRVWPEAPGHSNQALRYWLKPRDFRSEFASPVHRAQPDAFVTSLILCELLRVATVDDLIAWTDEPVLLPTVPARISPEEEVDQRH